MSVYGDLSKPQRAILKQLLEASAVSIETAHRCARYARVDPYGRLRELGLVELVAGRSFYGRVSPEAAWLTPRGLALIRTVSANRRTSRFRRFDRSACS